jgi:hypothetical protein
MEASKMILRRLLNHCNLLNSILVAASLLFASSFLLPRLDSNSTFVPSLIKKKPSEKNYQEGQKFQNPSALDYVSIANQNLFHPERKVPPEIKSDTILPKPEFVLYGTLITPDLSMAYLEDKKAPVTTPGRGRRQTALKKGESLSGFILNEIKPDKVVMSRGEEVVMVSLQEPGSPKTREGVTTPTIQVPSLGPSRTIPASPPSTMIVPPSPPSGQGQTPAGRRMDPFPPINPSERQIPGAQPIPPRP